MLKVEGVSCQRNDEPLFSGLTFSLNEGEVLHIFAGNGVGKTTLLKTIAGLLPVYIGKIIKTKSLLYIGHKNNIHLALSPLQNLIFLQQLNSAFVNRQQIQQSLNACGLEKIQDIPCSDLSAGQLQRVNLARLHLNCDSLWLLDEPLVNLDQEAKEKFKDISSRHLTRGGAILIAAHNNLSFAIGKILNLEDYA